MARKGRPTKAAKPGTKASLGLKVTASLKSRLEDAANASGRTQSQEAEYRLERSFDRQDIALEFLATRFGPETATALMILGHGMKAASLIGNIAKRAAPPSESGPVSVNWLSDQDVFDLVAATTAKILKGIRPNKSSNEDQSESIDWEALSDAATRTTMDVRATDTDDLSQIGRVVVEYLRGIKK